jgi:hypothetical protein
LADHRWQHIGCVLPTDEVEALECFVDEVERVSAIGKDAICLGREEQVRQGRGPSTYRDGGKCCSLGCLAMTDGRPTP